MYFGARDNFKVFGKRNVVEVLTFNDLEPLEPFKTLFLAAVALAGTRVSILIQYGVYIMFRADSWTLIIS